MASTSASNGSLRRLLDTKDVNALSSVDGMVVTRVTGQLRGRQPKLGLHQDAHLTQLHRAGEHPVDMLEELFPSPARPSTGPSPVPAYRS